MSPSGKKANRAQIVALHTLFAMWQAHSLDECHSDEREARLAWASQCLGYNVSSFSDITADDARRLIDVLKQSCGQPLSEQPQPWRRVPARDRAQEAGTAGRRKGVRSAVIHLASADDFARIDDALHRLGWTQDRFEAWLRSSSSPLPDHGGGRAAIRTLAEANKVFWAMKAMMIRAGVWQRKKAV